MILLNRHCYLVLAAACIGLVAGCSSARDAPAKTDHTAAAVAFVQNMADGKFTEAVAPFDAAMTQAMSADRLKQTWQATLAQYGAFKKMGTTRTAREGGFDEVFVPLEFANTTLDCKVVFDADGKIGGLWFVPHVDAAASQYSPPAYADSSRFTESEVTVGDGEWKLPGTLAMPKGAGPFPALVLVHGSGPNDRDESIGANKPFKDLALGLASKGIAVLRYDKRTKVYHDKLIGANPKHFTVKQETIDDAVAAVDLLQRTEKIDPKRVFVLGHSLGGMLVPRIAKADPKIAGLISMAGATLPLEDAMLDQITYIASLKGSLSEADKKQIDDLKAEIAKVKDVTPDSPSLLGVPASYWIDLRDYHPAEAAKSVKQPLFIIQGGRDYQVTTAGYDIWVKALSGKPNVTFKLYPSLNHLFMEGKGKSVPDEYTKRGPIPQYVIDDLATWIKAH